MHGEMREIVEEVRVLMLRLEGSTDSVERSRDQLREKRYIVERYLNGNSNEQEQVLESHGYASFEEIEIEYTDFCEFVRREKHDIEMLKVKLQFKEGRKEKLAKLLRAIIGLRLREGSVALKKGTSEVKEDEILKVFEEYMKHCY